MRCNDRSKKPQANKKSYQSIRATKLKSSGNDPKDDLNEDFN